MAIVDVAAVKVRPDLGGFRAELRGDLSKIDVDFTINVGVDVDLTGAKAHLLAFRKEEELKPIKQPVDVDRSIFSQVGSVLKGLGGILGTTTGDLGRFASAFAQVGLKMGGIASIAMSAGSAIGALGPLLLQSVGVLAVVPGLIGAAAVTMATFALGMDGIKAAFKGLTPQLDALKTAVSASFQSALLPAVNNLKVILPGLKTGFQEIATALGGIATKVTGAFQTPAGLTALNTVLDLTSRIIQNVGKAVAPLAVAFVNIANIGLNAIQPFTTGLGTAAQSFADFTASAQGVQKIQGFISGGVSALKQLGEILTTVGSIAFGVFQGIQAGGGGLGASFLPALHAIDAFVHSAEGFSVLSSIGSLVSTLGQAFVDVLVPALAQLSPIITAVVPIITQLAGIFTGALQPVIVLVGQTILALLPAVSALMPVFNAVAGAVAQLAPVLGTLVTGLIQALVPVISALAQAFVPLLPPIQTLVSTLVPPLVALFNQLSPILSQMAGLIGQVLVAAIGLITPLFPPLVQIIQALLPPILQLVNALLPPLAQLFDAVAPIIGLVAQVIAQLIGALAPLIPPITQLISALLPPLISLFTLILKPVLALVSALLGPLTGAISAIVGAVGKVLGVFGNLLSSLVNAALSLFNWFGDLPSKIFGAIGDLVGRFVQFGADLLSGLARGIANAVGFVLDKVKEVGGKIVSGIKDFFGIGSPSRLMAKEVGRWIPAGIGKGIDDYAYLATDPFGSLVDGMSADPLSAFTSAGGVVNGALQIQGNGIEGAVERGLSRAQFSLDSRGIATITTTGQALNYAR